MGRVLTEIKVQNIEDLYLVKRGALKEDQIRQVIIPDALVDTGATLLSLPTSVIRALGLDQTTTKRVTSSIGQSQANIYEAVRLTIQDRFCAIDVLEVPDGVPALVGQLPLENLDFVVDPKAHQLIGNPRHNGEHVYELY
jgi:predicted aspartyl protease